MRALRFVLFAGLAACGGGAAVSPSGDAGAADSAPEVSPEAIPEVGDTAAEASGPADAPRETPSSPADAAADAGVDAPPEAPTPRTIGSLYCPASAPTANPLPAGAQPKLIPIAPPGGIMFLEGPVWLADRGVLLLSEWNNGHRILQLTPPQSIEVFLPSSGTNGLAITPDAKGLLVVTEAPAAGVSRIELPDKSVQRLVRDFNGQAFVQPNDLVVRADGTIFFTDYQAGRLYRRATDGQVTMVAAATHANGVGLSPDEKTLYLNADTRTLKYPLAPDGALGTGTDLATGLMGADGLAIDCAGNVYIAQNAGGAIVVVSAAGAKLGELGGLPKTVTNAAFGGAERRTLYITTSTGLYAVDLTIPGLPY